MTAPAWHDHEIEPGGGSPVAVLGAAWHEQLRAMMTKLNSLAEHGQQQRKQLADLQRRHQATLHELRKVRAERDQARQWARRWKQKAIDYREAFERQLARGRLTL